MAGLVLQLIDGWVDDEKRGRCMDENLGGWIER